MKLKLKQKTIPTPSDKSLRCDRADDRIGNSRYTRVIYISHPYGGKKENKDKIEKTILDLQKQYPDYLFISPVHAFSFLYDTVPYEEGLQMCLWLLHKCDEAWVIGNWRTSKGVCREIIECVKTNIPYRIFEDCSGDCLRCPLSYFKDGNISCSVRWK